MALQIQAGDFGDAGQPVVERVAVDVQRPRGGAGMGLVGEPGFGGAAQLTAGMLQPSQRQTQLLRLPAVIEIGQQHR